MTRVAAIDCGTNTIKCLIADIEEDRAEEVARTARMVRLGQDVDRTGRLAPEALARAFEAVEEIAALVEQYAVERIRFVATSATRDAANGAEFTAGVRERLGVEPEVLDGESEGRLAFVSAVGSLRREVGWPVLVVDIGGGSTELVIGERSGEREGRLWSHSMDVGSVRLFERHVRHDPATPAELAAICADIDAALNASPVDPAAAGGVVGMAGTVCQVAALVLGLEAYDRSRVDHCELGVDRVREVVEELCAMTVAQRRDLPAMHPGRADVIVAGALVLLRVLERSGADSLLVTEAGLLDGIAFSLVHDLT